MKTHGAGLALSDTNGHNHYHRYTNLIMNMGIVMNMRTHGHYSTKKILYDAVTKIRKTNTDDVTNDNNTNDDDADINLQKSTI